MSSGGGWAVWSRRPSDPTQAPGIIISTNAKPPLHVVRDALDVPTPPPSPPPTLLTDDTDITTTTETSTQDHTPLSSNTSVDLNEPQKDTDEPPEDEGNAVTQAPAAPVPAPPKKSWASLLQPSASTSKRNALPTSTVVGFSVPASCPTSPSPTPSAHSTLPFSKPQRTELLSLLTSGPPPNLSNSGTVADIRPRGLINAGNMCFANSVLQVLVYSPPFYRLFSALCNAGVHLREKDRESQNRDRETPLPLVEATAEFVKAFSPARERDNGPSVVNGRGKMNGYAKGKGKERERAGEWDEWGAESFLPNYVFDAMKENKRFDSMRSGQQEDAEEFLGFYLDTLEEELLALHQALAPTSIPAESDSAKHKGSTKAGEVEETLEKEEGDDGWLEVGKRNRMVVTRTIKGAESPITRIFGGKFRSTLRAPQQKDSVIVEDWRALRLDIQHDSVHTIQDALAHISSPQLIQLSNPTRPGSQQVLIEALPAVLVVHLKRFCFMTDAGAATGQNAVNGGGKPNGGVVKVGKQVQYGRELVVGPDVMAPAIRRPQGVKYRLFGVVYHHGHSASGGHYTLDVLHPSRFPKAQRTATSPCPSSPGSDKQQKLPLQMPTKPTFVPPGSVFTANVHAKQNHGVDETEQGDEHDPREGWIRIDDELVSDVRPEDVFNYGGSGSSEEGRCAYLLFYRRVR